MLKRILIITLSSTLILFILTTIKLEDNTTTKKEKYHENIKITTKAQTETIKKPKKNNLNKNIIKYEKPIGKIIIDKININKDLYNISSKKNNVEENITILKESIFPPNPNSIVFIAAHSGNGKKAYFNNLNKLNKNDNIIIEYKQTRYNYVVNNIWETEKNGYTITGFVEKSFLNS